MAGGHDKVILRDQQIAPDFFDLSTGFAGELVQKCMNYQIRLAIVATDRHGWSVHFRQFADESTRHGHFIFVQSTEDARAQLA